ncbi:MAG: hypothetical protein VX878_00280, partial [Pseudomonadota bacterium]|nr:hypothetical protein [Pseudomonadota bacterium]
MSIHMFLACRMGTDTPAYCPWDVRHDNIIVSPSLSPIHGREDLIPDSDRWPWHMMWQAGADHGRRWKDRHRVAARRDRHPENSLPFTSRCCFDPASTNARRLVIHLKARSAFLIR